MKALSCLPPVFDCSCQKWTRQRYASLAVREQATPKVTHSQTPKLDLALHSFVVDDATPEQSQSSTIYAPPRWLRFVGTSKTLYCSNLSHNLWMTASSK